MKNILFRVIIFCCFVCKVFSQENPQNPNHQKSIEKYAKVYDSINRMQSTTLHQTYKAYDWYEEKMEIKAARRNARLERKLNRSRFRPSGWNNMYRYSNYLTPYTYGYPVNNIGSTLLNGLTAAYLLDQIIH